MKKKSATFLRRAPKFNILVLCNNGTRALLLRADSYTSGRVVYENKNGENPSLVITFKI